MQTLSASFIFYINKIYENREDSLMATKAKISFKPLGNRVVIEPSDTEEQMSSGGIYIPDTVQYMSAR